MKMHNIAKLGLLMLVLLITTGAAAADGGSSYSTASTITVPNGDIDIWSGTCKASPGDWYKFSVTRYDDCYIDLHNQFYTAGGSMKLYDGTSYVSAQIAHPTIDHYATDIYNLQPRIQILKGTKSTYQFIAGRNFVPPL